ncbi:unnamed protein product, partial [Rotaria sp. Silwood1]
NSETKSTTLFHTEGPIKIEKSVFDAEKILKISSTEKTENPIDQSEHRLDYKISKPNASIPKLDRIDKQQITEYLSPVKTFTNYASITEELRQFYQTLTLDSTQTGEQSWDIDERHFTGLQRIANKIFP